MKVAQLESPQSGHVGECRCQSGERCHLSLPQCRPSTLKHRQAPRCRECRQVPLRPPCGEVTGVREEVTGVSVGVRGDVIASTFSLSSAKRSGEVMVARSSILGLNTDFRRSREVTPWHKLATEYMTSASLTLSALSSGTSSQVLRLTARSRFSTECHQCRGTNRVSPGCRVMT
ncbi:hypothetical protein E2C01_047775 [Portunus trituberculatus]|uniref:Uncharacterized protein n=1 Tax=Portunus trituberculatus TaxID=210409 RepID=A0A5B7G4H1_PORTR|nr:hypothetical protein [Portunus trituberculatus]